MTADLLYELARLFTLEASTAPTKEADRLVDVADELFRRAREAMPADEAA